MAPRTPSPVPPAATGSSLTVSPIVERAGLNLDDPVQVLDDDRRSRGHLRDASRRVANALPGVGVGEDLIEHGRPRLVSYERTTRAVVIDDFPMTIARKIRKPALAERLNCEQDGAS